MQSERGYVFATGGIGGVHRGAVDSFDISHDLQSLARSRVVTVCAGAKAILDLPKTLEYLETAGVCVIGYQTTSFPAFYSRDSGLPLEHSAESADVIARAFVARERLGLSGGLLVAAPIPVEYEIPADQISASIDLAVKQAAECGVHGKDVTLSFWRAWRGSQRAVRWRPIWRSLRTMRGSERGSPRQSAPL